MNLNEVRQALSQPVLARDYGSLLSEIRSLKKSAVSVGEGARANQIWCLEEAATTQKLFIDAFLQLKAGQYYDGWCTLEQVELALSRLKPYGQDDWVKFRLDFISQKTMAIQGLYPYKMFLSPEIVCLEQKCSICGKVVSVRSPCGHRVKELYDGEWCFRIITRSEFIGLSFVESPVQKYSVPFMHDPASNQTKDHYDYTLLKYLVDRLPGPYHNWRLRWEKALHAKTRFGMLRMNDKCPCDSGRRYKKCCLRRNGILRPHAVFEFENAPPEELRTIEFTY